MTTGTELQIPPSLQPRPQNSPLHRARLQRKLTAEAAARRADVAPAEVGSPAERRLCRFPSKHVALPRILGAAALAAIFAVVAVALADPRLAGETEGGADAANLPPPWRVSVDVLNGSDDLDHTRTVADRIGALAYDVAPVRRADRSDYRETAVYYQLGGKAIAARLAASLGTKTKPLPGGKDPRHVIVIVGPATTH